MASKLPDGSTVFVGAALAAEKKVTAITNANPAVATATAHGLANGEYVLVSSGWGKLDGRVVKVEKVNENDFKLLDIDTTDTEKFPVGGGVGDVKKVSSWVQVRQVLEFSIQGGEQQYANFSYLEDDFERQLPSSRSAMSLNMRLGDDANLPGYQALKRAGNGFSLTPLRLNLKDGAVITYSGIVSLNETPSTEKGQVMSVQVSVALQALPLRHA